MSRAVLWDLGHTLVDWDPRRVYRSLLSDDAAVEQFLGGVCTMAWHTEHDRGVPMAENREHLIAKYPHYEDAIRAWETGLDGMLNGSVPGTDIVMDTLAERGVPQYALTNLPAEWVEPVNTLYPQMAHMKDVIVSAHEGVIKPDRRIYEITAMRLPFAPEEVVFFDDRENNVTAAREFGFDAEVFRGEGPLKAALAARGLL